MELPKDADHNIAMSTGSLPLLLIRQDKEGYIVSWIFIFQLFSLGLVLVLVLV